jgi:hypothetical protein
MASESRCQDFECFFTRVLGETLDSFDASHMLEQEIYLAEVLQGMCIEDIPTSTLKQILQEKEDQIAQSIHKRDRLRLILPSIVKETNASRSCERTLHQCCVVLAEEIEQLDNEFLEVLDELKSSVSHMDLLLESDYFIKEQSSVTDILNLNDSFLESVLSCADAQMQRQLCAGKAENDVRPGRSDVTLKSYFENRSGTDEDQESLSQIQELHRLQDSFRLIEEDKISSAAALAMAKETTKVLIQQHAGIRSAENLASMTSAESTLLERQEETQKYLREYTVLQHEIVLPLVRQLSKGQGLKFLRGACKIRIENEQKAQSAWTRIQTLAEHQQTRIEILEAVLEIDKIQHLHSHELIAAASTFVSHAAENKMKILRNMEKDAQGQLDDHGIEHFESDHAEDFERILAALGGHDDKFAMAVPTAADVIATAQRAGTLGPKAVEERQSLLEGHIKLWSTLRRTSQGYHRALHTMPAGPGRPIGMPSDLEEALQALSRAGADADRHLEEVLQYRDAARIASGAGAGSVRVVTDFFVQPQRLQDEVQALRDRCAALGWRAPSVAGQQGS